MMTNVDNVTTKEKKGGQMWFGRMMKLKSLD